MGGFSGKRIEEIHDGIDNIHMNAEVSHIVIYACRYEYLSSESVDSCLRRIQMLAMKTRS